MSAALRKPTARICERCDRSERWDEELGAWQLVRKDGDPIVGDPHCIHEWDINGTFDPFGNA